MNPKTSTTLDYLRRLRSRTRWLQIGTSIVQLVGIVLLILVGAAISLSLGASLEPTRITFYLMSALAIVGLCSIAVVKLSRWKGLDAHAHHVEQLFPVFRGRLVLSMNQKIQGAAFLVTRIRTTVTDLLGRIDPAQIHNSRVLKANFWRTAGVLVLLFVFEFTLPITPSAALAAFQTGQVPLAQPPSLETVSQEEEVLLGDIMLRYTFPEHTRMTPIDIPNSDGSVHGPIGSKVSISARADKRYKSAALVIGNQEPEAVTLTNGRNIQFDINIAGNSEWILLFSTTEDEWYPTKKYPIQVDNDDPPIVTITEPLSRSQIPINKAFKLPWSVTDDFGIERISVEVMVAGQTTTQILEQPESLRLMIDGRLRTSPAMLGLNAGDEVELKLVAYDNQPPVLLEGEEPVSSVDENAPIGKRGESMVMRFTVMGPKLSAQRLIDLNKRLKALLVPVLADFLVDPTPPSAKPIGMVQWAKTAGKRLHPLQSYIEAEWGDAPPSDMSAELVFTVLDNASRLFRFTYSTYDLHTGGPQPKAEDSETFQDLHQVEVEALEKAVYLIDMMLRQVASRQVSSIVKQLDQRADSLSRNLGQENNSEAEMRQLEQIEMLMEELNEQSEGLGDGSLRPFVQSRNNEARQLLEAAKQALSENNPQSTLLQQQLAENISQLADGVEEQRLRQESQQEEMVDFIKEVMEKLEAAQAEQQSLSNELETRRSESGTAQQQGNLWDEIERLSQASVSESEDLLGAIGSGEGFHPRAIRYTEALSADLNMLLRAVRAREQADSLEKLFKAELSRDLANGMFQRSRMSSETRLKITRHAGQIQELNGQILDMLNQLQELQNDADPSNDLARQQQAPQTDLQQQMQSLMQDIEKIEQTLPTADGSASEFGEQASQDMASALRYMQQSKGMSTEGMQRSAAQNIQNTRDRLQQQLNEFMQMQQQMQQMDPSDGEEGNQGDEQTDNEMELRPANSQFNTLEDEKTPEEYRQELLEGMAADVPEEYRQQKKRYYEELVQQ